jgi:hypothetical protein
MFPKTSCCCGSAATMHVTDASTRPAIGSHYCDVHAPDECEREFHSLARAMWRRPSAREFAVALFANELGLSQDEIRNRLDRSFGRLED